MRGMQDALWGAIVTVWQTQCGTESATAPEDGNACQRPICCHGDSQGSAIGSRWRADCDRRPRLCTAVLVEQLRWCEDLAIKVVGVTVAAETAAAAEDAAILQQDTNAVVVARHIDCIC